MPSPKPLSRVFRAIRRVKDAPKARRVAADFSRKKSVLDATDRPRSIKAALCKHMAPQSASKPSLQAAGLPLRFFARCVIMAPRPPSNLRRELEAPADHAACACQTLELIVPGVSRP
jgi:hypothetical protein